MCSPRLTAFFFGSIRPCVTQIQKHLNLVTVEEKKIRQRLAYDKWRRANPEKAKAATKRWIRENAEKNRATARARRNRRRKAEPGFKLKHVLGCRLRKVMKRTSAKKCAGTLRLLGCSVEQFRSYLESQFKPGMTWENYGSVWHIDHIKPCAKFNLLDPEQQRLCFHWSNMQPLFALENRHKSDKYEN